MKIYVTLGQYHRHKIGDLNLDKDTLVEIDCVNPFHGKCRAQILFSNKFCAFYREKDLDEILTHFPKGIKNVSFAFDA